MSERNAKNRQKKARVNEAAKWKTVKRKFSVSECGISWVDMISSLQDHYHKMIASEAHTHRAR